MGNYTGVSVVDYLKQQGQPTDFASRAVLAASKGISGYSGTAQQNTQLLNMLRGGGTPTPTTTVASPSQPSPSQQPQGQTVPGQTGQPGSIQDLIGMGFYGYQGWDPVAAMADYKATGGAGKGGPQATTTGTTGTTGIGTAFLNQPTINLPDIYQGLYDTSGISGIESELSAKSKAYTEAVAKIKDNPYLSEATMTGRLSKLSDKFNADTANLRSDIATKKADVETKLNIQMKQFDINSQQAKQALDQFQTLLSSGALNNASGEDIANITRATGMSSSMIKAAIDATKKKNIQTSTIQWDDGTNQGFAIINSDTGEIIKKDVVAASKPKAASTSATTNVNNQFLEEAKTIKGQQTDSGWIGEFPLLVAKYAPFMSLEEIYKLYMKSYLGQKWGTPKESASDIKEIYDAYRGA